MLLTGEADVIAKDSDDDDDDDDEQLPKEMTAQLLELNNKSDRKSVHKSVANADADSRDNLQLRKSLEGFPRKANDLTMTNSKMLKFPVLQRLNSDARNFVCSAKLSSNLILQDNQLNFDNLNKNCSSSFNRSTKSFDEDEIPLRTEKKTYKFPICDPQVQQNASFPHPSHNKKPHNNCSDSNICLENLKSSCSMHHHISERDRSSCDNLRNFPPSNGYSINNRRKSFPYTQNYSSLRTGSLQSENIAKKLNAILDNMNICPDRDKVQGYIVTEEKERDSQKVQDFLSPNSLLKFRECHINDSKLATAKSMAKNTAPTDATIQIHDRDDESHNFVPRMREFITRASTSASTPQSATREPQLININNSENRNELQLLETPTPPPPTTTEHSGILAELLADAAALNTRSITRVDSTFHTSEMPAACSDVRGSSSQAVPLLNDLRARCQGRKELFASEQLLPSLAALERNEPGDPEVDELVDIVKNKVVADSSKIIANEFRAHFAEKSRSGIDDAVASASESAKSELSEAGAGNARDGNYNELCLPEMKIEMKGVKGSLPETEVLRRRAQFNKESNLDSVLKERGPTMSPVEPKYRPSATRFGLGLNGDVSRTVSVDSGDGDLPGRTQLRRQRRMKSVDAGDQPEDPIERLNRLRARITGALSEVKGVLKQYSTEAEGEGEKETATLKEDSSKPNEDEGPIHFRFVKKVRRRSTFNEEDEEVDGKKAVEENKEKFEENKEKSIEDEKNKTAQEEDKKETLKEDINKNQSIEIDQKKLPDNSESNDLEETLHQEKSEEKVKVVKEEIERSLPSITTAISEVPIDSPKAETKEHLEITPHTTDKVNVLQSEVKNAKDFLKTSLLPEIKEKSVTEEPKADLQSESGLRKPSPVKLKKKSSSNAIVDRRSSIAAVEGSKIAPPVIPTASLLNLKAQRRPSDSAAIVKKKAIVSNTAAGESVPKVKIIHKVKRPPVKKSTAVTATTSDNASTAETVAKSTAATPTEIITDSKARSNFSDKDTKTTAATTSTLAMQSMIDGASLTSVQPTKGHAATVATLSSPLRASEANGQAKDEAEELAKLLGETILIRPSGKLAEAVASSSKAQRVPVNGSTNVRTSSISNDKIADSRLNEDLKKPEIRERQENKDLINQGKLQEETSPSNRIVKQIGFNIQQQECEDSEPAQTLTRLPDLSDPTADVITAANTTAQTSLGKAIAAEDTKTIIAATTTHSPEVTSKRASSEQATGAAAMPELQLKAVQVFAEPSVAPPFDVSNDSNSKKKPLFRKVIAKNGEATAKKPQSNGKTAEVPPKEEKIETSIQTELEDKSEKMKETADSSIDQTDSPSVKEIKDVQAETTEGLVIVEGKTDNVSSAEENLVELEEQILQADEVKQVEEETAVEVVKEKKKRRIKKKVIIKREQHKLSLSDNFFKSSGGEEPSTPNEETLEKPIEFVKVDTDEEQEYEEIAKPKKPTRSCLMTREFQVGDEVMYAERYRKTQVRWKRGKVLERITSISYKLEVEGKELAAHISYIKRYNARKVNFGGKEYLEIDYEQIAEEEEKEERLKARSYSIWNMV